MARLYGVANFQKVLNKAKTLQRYVSRAQGQVITTCALLTHLEEQQSFPCFLASSPRRWHVRLAPLIGCLPRSSRRWSPLRACTDHSSTFGISFFIHPFMPRCLYRRLVPVYPFQRPPVEQNHLSPSIHVTPQISHGSHVSVPLVMQCLRLSDKTHVMHTKHLTASPSFRFPPMVISMKHYTWPPRLHRNVDIASPVCA